jgi:hypothetical protein
MSRLLGRTRHRLDAFRAGLRLGTLLFISALGFWCVAFLSAPVSRVASREFLRAPDPLLPKSIEASSDQIARQRSRIYSEQRERERRVLRLRVHCADVPLAEVQACEEIMERGSERHRFLYPDTIPDTTMVAARAAAEPPPLETPINAIGDLSRRDSMLVALAVESRYNAIRDSLLQFLSDSLARVSLATVPSEPSATAQSDSQSSAGESGDKESGGAGARTDTTLPADALDPFVSGPAEQQRPDLLVALLIVLAFGSLGVAVYLYLLHPLMLTAATGGGGHSPPTPQAKFVGAAYLIAGAVLLALALQAAGDCFRVDPPSLKRSFQIALLFSSAGLALIYMCIRRDKYTDLYEALQLFGGAVGVPNTFAAVLLPEL